VTQVLEATVRSPGGLRLANRPLAPPADGLVRLGLESAGICGTDLAVLEGSLPLARYPLTLGHEFVGRVDTAPKESSFRPGDWAVVFPTITCGSCRACARGRENQCAEMRVLGISDRRGCFAETVDLPPSQILAIGEDAGRSHGSLIEPLAVACHVIERAQLEDGDRVTIVGAGVIGLSCAAVARARHQVDVALVDRVDRSEIAAALGFRNVGLTDSAGRFQHVVDDGADAVIDCVVSQTTIADSVALLAAGGRLITVATPKNSHPLRIDYGPVYARELQLAAARNYTRSNFASALGLLERGLVDLRPLVTASYRLAEAVEAVEQLRRHPEHHLKIQLTP
jgi:2-desacetyl-2-hydroxyethyl bacteriochlorophyllide A dehydrogenase